MKKSFIILLLLSMPCMLIAQEKIKQKEIGLTFSNLDNFGITFRTGTDKSLWRFNTLFLSGNSNERTADSALYKRTDTGIGIQAGKEYRKVMARNFELRFGVDLSFAYSKQKSKTDANTNDPNYHIYESTAYIPGVKLVLGLNYVLNSNLVIGAELLPGISYSTGRTKETYAPSDTRVISDNSGWTYGITNSSALLSLVYRF